MDRTVHGIHWECYKKYTLILSKRKSINDEVNSPEKRPKRDCSIYEKSEKTGVKLFPKYCFFCKMFTKKIKGKRHESHKITMKSTEIAIKDAAHRKNDRDLLLHIENQDLLSREFQVHDQCRRLYTNKPKEGENETPKATSCS